MREKGKSDFKQNCIISCVYASSSTAEGVSRQNSTGVVTMPACTTHTDMHEEE